MKNLKVCWPSVIAIALAVSIVSCHNEQMVKEYNHDTQIEHIKEVEENINELNERIHNIKLDEVVIPEGLEIDTNEEEASYSK